MKRLFSACAIAALCGPLAACSPPFAIFEDVGTDPHPPQIEFLGMAYQPEEPAEGVAPEPDLQPGEGFVILPLDDGANELLFRLRYSDAGGDLQFFVVRDRDGSLMQEISPTAPEVDRDGDGEPDTVDTPDYFSGTAGEVDLPNVVFESTMIGPHRLEIWAEDSHGSRSEKVTFTVQVAL